MNAAVSLLLTASGAVLPPPECGPKAILLPPQPDGSCLQSLSSALPQAPLIPQPPPPSNIRTRGRPSRDEAFILFSPPPPSQPPMNPNFQSQAMFSPNQMLPRPMPPPTLRDLLYQNHMLQMQNALLRQRLLQYEQQSLMGALLMTAMQQRLPQPPPPQPSSFHLSRSPSTMPHLPRPFPPNFYHYDVVPTVTAAPPGPPSPPPFFAGGAFPRFPSELVKPRRSSKSQHPLFVLFQRRRKRAARLDPQLPAFTAPIKRSRSRQELGGEEKRKKLEWSCVSMGGQCLCCCGGRRPDAAGICREEAAALPLPSILQLAPTHPAQEMAMELAKEEFWPVPIASSTPSPPPTTPKSQPSHLDKHFPSIARILKLR